MRLTGAQPGLCCGGMSQKSVFENVAFKCVLSKLVQLKLITNVGLGAELLAAGHFFVIFWKKIAILRPFGSQFARFWTPFRKLLLLEFVSHLKELN